MKTYTVYRVDYVTKMRVPVGQVTERRQKERGDNEAGILKLAEKLYLKSSIFDKSYVIVSPDWRGS